MTLHEVSSQLFQLTKGHVNGERYTKAQLDRVIHMWMRDSETLTIRNRRVITVALPDGEWPATIDKFHDSVDGFDYWIPDTMEEAQGFWSRFTKAYQQKCKKAC